MGFKDDKEHRNNDDNFQGCFMKDICGCSLRWRIIWIIFVVVSFTVVGWQLASLISVYLNYEIVSNSNIIHKSSLEFPSVTVCNINPISFENVKVEVASDTLIKKWLAFTSSEASGKYAERVHSYQALYENLPDEARRIAHDWGELIVQCRFNNEVCSASNFTEHFDSLNHYKCYTFNGADTKEKLISRGTGPVNGLSLIISLNEADRPSDSHGLDNLFKSTPFGSGARFQIHPPNSIPSPLNDGFDLLPGYSSNVGLKLVQYKELPSPYGSCTTENMEDDFEYHSTLSSCFLLCKQRQLVRQCDCKSSAFPEYLHTKNIPFCGTLQQWQTININSSMDKSLFEKLECEGRVLSEINLQETCKCSPPCDDVSYEESISSSYWPMESHQSRVLQELYGQYITQPDFASAAYKLLGRLSGINESDEYLTIRNRASTLIRQNLLHVNIFFKEFKVMEFIQTVRYDWYDLLTKIGWTLGLWVAIFSLLWTCFSSSPTYKAYSSTSA